MDPAPGDDAFLTLADLLVDIAREIRIGASHSAPVVPLTQTQGQVMRYIHNHPGCSPSAIADGSGLQRANVSAALRDLRGRGYITSVRDDADGRAVRIHATPLSEEVISRLRRSWADVLERAWELTPELDGDLESMLRSLARLHAGLDAERASNTFRIPSPAEPAPDADSTSIPAPR
ncbi:MAG: MarR family transcriptional regulator [Microbacterium sp.]|uniref:MarR family winged helix-turn-helix transcriptional regulator n=1 Tax=Microbacterium sp. TaxID=51671 RepID=UPI0039E6A833